MKNLKLKTMSACLLSLFLAEPASAAKISFIGYFQITNQVGTCARNQIGRRGTVHFMPEILGSDNGSGSRMIWYEDIFAQGFSLGTGLFANTFKSANATYMGRYIDTTTNSVRFVTQTPSTILATTKSITVVGQIRDYDFSPGCTINFEMSVGRYVL